MRNPFKRKARLRKAVMDPERGTLRVGPRADNPRVIDGISIVNPRKFWHDVCQVLGRKAE